MDTKVHKILEAGDKVTLIGELEHLRRHEILAAHTERTEAMNSSTKTESQLHESKEFAHLGNAGWCKKIRRQIMAECFPDVKETDWCSVKSAASLKQLALECGDSLPYGMQDALLTVANSILTDAIGIDMSGCVSCREDKKEVEDGENSRG